MNVLCLTKLRHRAFYYYFFFLKATSVDCVSKRVPCSAEELLKAQQMIHSLIDDWQSVKGDLCAGLTVPTAFWRQWPRTRNTSQPLANSLISQLIVKMGWIFTDVFIIFAWQFNEHVFFFLSCKCALCILKDYLLYLPSLLLCFGCFHSKSGKDDRKCWLC